MIDEAINKADEIDVKINEFFDRANGLINRDPGPLTDLIDPIISGLKNQLEDTGILGKVKDFLNNTGRPSKLKKYSEKWRDVIGNPIGQIAIDLGQEQLATHTEWTGSGAEAYKSVVPTQSAGLNRMETLSIQLSETLKSLAIGIENFWIAIGIALGSLVIGIVAAIVEAATVVRVPAAIITALGTIGVTVIFIGIAIVELKGIYDTIDTS